MSGGTIAIVDDNTDVLASIKIAMESCGFEVQTYSSARSFLEDSAVRPACLIIDHNMPGMTGIELVTQLRREEDRIPVLLTTGFVTTDVAESAALLDIENVFQKPITIRRLLKFVDKYC